jgi:hypothetical protein
MNQHVKIKEFTNDPNRFLDDSLTAPVFIERSNGTSVLLSKEEYEHLKGVERRLDRRGSEGLLAAMSGFDPLPEDERLGRIPDQPPEPFDL